MPASQLTAVRSIRTDDVAPTDRLEYWEHYNAEALVGLRCGTYSVEGLVAQESNFEIDDLKLAHIDGNPHIIERTPDLVRNHPKESIFATLLMEGSGFFYHPEGCLPVHAGDVIVYDTLHPYLFAFGSDMRQLLIDVPRETMQQQFGRSDIDRPIVSSAQSATVQALTGALFGPEGGGSAPRIEIEKSSALVEFIATMAGLANDLGAIRQQQALSFIAANISNPELSAADVASALGVTLRHLNRSMAQAGTSVSRTIREERLDRAILALQTTVNKSISDIAAEWGFSSHAQLSTLVRRHYDLTPSEVRDHPGPLRFVRESR